MTPELSASSKVNLINPSHLIGQNCDGSYINYRQEIPQTFLDECRTEREDSLSTPHGEMVRVARIPTAVIDKWDREGFDYNRAPVQDILRKLQLDQLDSFITTKQRHHT